MLVITRREGEEVVIGDPRNPIGVVRIASIRGDRVRIAFDFPRSIQVHRREVAAQILDENVQPQIVASLRPKVAAGAGDAALGSSGSGGSLPISGPVSNGQNGSNGKLNGTDGQQS